MELDEARSRPNLFPVAAVGLAMVAFILIKTGRDAVFFSRGGSLQDLPLAYIWIGAAALPAAMLHIRLMRRLGTRKSRVALLVLAALGVGAFVPFVVTDNPLTMGAFFVFVPVLFAAVFASVWLLTADLLEGSSGDLRRRTYAWVGGASTLGGVLGGLLAKLLAHLLAPRFLVLAGGLVLLAIAALARRAHRRHPVSGSSTSEVAAPEQSARQLVRLPLVRLLLAISALSAVAGLLIEFQFYAVAAASGSTDTNFFANFYILLSLASLVLQLSVSPFIQSRIGVGGTLLVMPIALFGAAALVTVTATILGRAVLKVGESGLKSAIHRTAWEQAFLPLAREARGRAKALIDGGAARLAEGLTALGIYLHMRLGDVAAPNLLWLSLGTVVALFAWVALTARIRSFGLDSSEEVEEAIRLPESCPVTSTLGASCPRAAPDE